MSGRQSQFRAPLIIQSGAALIMCLMLLGVLSLLGLSAATEHQMQFRMGRNLDVGLERRHSAEQALNWAEDWLLGLAGNDRPEACIQGCSPVDVVRPEGALGPEPQHQNLAWWQANGQAAGYVPGSEPAGFAGPWYVIEEVHLEPSVIAESLQQETAYYRILARSSSVNNTQSGIAESLLARPWGHESLSDGFPPSAESVSFCKSELIEPPCGRVAWRVLK